MATAVCVYVCLSVRRAFLHYCTDLGETLRNVRGAPYSGALLGGFAIGSRFRCYGNICTECEMSVSALVLDLLLVSISCFDFR